MSDESRLAWASCYTCRDYARERREVIAVPLANKARAQGRDVVEVVDEFMAAAHERHLDGNPLRPGGPTRVTNPTAGRLLATYAMLGQMLESPKRPPHDAEMAAARDADRVARVCCGGECSGCPVGDVNLAGLVADMQDECSHEWLDRPESDTYECLICGAEGQGTPPTPDRVARVAEGGGL